MPQPELAGSDDGPPVLPGFELPTEETVSITPVSEDSGTETAGDESTGEAETPAPDPVSTTALIGGGAIPTEAGQSENENLPDGSSAPQGYSIVLELLVEEDEEVAVGTQEFALSDVSITLSQEMLSALDLMRSNIDSSHQQEDALQNLVTRTGTAAALTLTAGFVTWLLRTGSMLATVFSTTPLWSRFDPIPVLAAVEEEEDKDQGRDKDEDEDEDRRNEKDNKPREGDDD